MSEASIFHLAVERVLNGWTALQLSVEHGMGGAESAAKATWMVDAIDQWFQENEDIEVDELEDFLANILDAEFDTVADDGSLQEVSSLICGYFRLCQTGKEVQVQEQISRLPKAKVGQSKQTANDCDGMDEMECDAGPSTSQASRGHRPPEEAATAQSEQTSGISADEDMDAEDDGWTVVKKGTKRR